MNENNLAVFVDGAARFFNKSTDNDAHIGTPFLIQDINEYLSDYTGIIGISGNHKGSVFFTAPQQLLIRLISAMGVLTTRDDKLMDLVGEVSNTVAGNARAEFGDQFMLTVPIVLKGTTDDIKVQDVASIYIIPIIWQNMTAHLIINLDEN